MLKKIKIKYQAHKLNRAQKKEAKIQRKHLLRNAPSAFDEAIFSWVAPETIQHQRGTTWKIIASIVALSAMLLGIYLGAWSFSLAIATFIGAYYLINLEHPKDVEVKISEIGIKVGSRKYSFSKIKAFWLIYNPPYTQTLNIRVSGEFLVDITIQLGGHSPAPVREYLMAKIPEMEGQSEKLSDLILRLLKI